jgi:hypothetical protein
MQQVRSAGTCQKKQNQNKEHVQQMWKTRFEKGLKKIYYTV